MLHWELYKFAKIEMSEEYDVDKTPYIIYGATTFTYWAINTILGYTAYQVSFGGNGIISGLLRIIYMWAFDFLYQPFMAPISIWWLFSLSITGLYKFMYGFWNGWSLAGIWFFNFFGLYWVDLWIMLQASVLGFFSAKRIYNILPAFRAWFWTKTVTLLAHFVVFFMYHKKYRTYFKYM